MELGCERTQASHSILHSAAYSMQLVCVPCPCVCVCRVRCAPCAGDTGLMDPPIGSHTNHNSQGHKPQYFSLRRVPSIKTSVLLFISREYCTVVSTVLPCSQTLVTFSFRLPRAPATLSRPPELWACLGFALRLLVCWTATLLQNALTSGWPC